MLRATRSQINSHGKGGMEYIRTCLPVICHAISTKVASVKPHLKRDIVLILGFEGVLCVCCLNEALGSRSTLAEPHTEWAPTGSCSKGLMCSVGKQGDNRP